jgi:hypothetical protein
MDSGFLENVIVKRIRTPTVLRLDEYLKDPRAYHNTIPGAQKDPTDSFHYLSQWFQVRGSKSNESSVLKIGLFILESLCSVDERLPLLVDLLSHDRATLWELYFNPLVVEHAKSSNGVSLSQLRGRREVDPNDLEAHQRVIVTWSDGRQFEYNSGVSEFLLSWLILKVVARPRCDLLVKRALVWGCRHENHRQRTEKAIEGT